MPVRQGIPKRKPHVASVPDYGDGSGTDFPEIPGWAIEPLGKTPEGDPIVILRRQVSLAGSGCLAGSYPGTYASERRFDPVPRLFPGFPVCTSYPGGMTCCFCQYSGSARRFVNAGTRDHPHDVLCHLCDTAVPAPSMPRTASTGSR
jgi:hypothetical protein